MNSYIDPISKLFGNWSANLTVWSILLRLALSIVFAFYVGRERSTKGHTAGLKTFLLFAMSSVSCMIIDKSLGKDLPICSLAFVIGSAMISGNSILFGAKNQIKGLTTSAWLWTCGIFGLVAGAGLYTPAVIILITCMITLQALPAIESAMKQRSSHFELHVELAAKTDLPNFMTTLRRLGMKIDDVEVNSAFFGTGLSVYSMRLTIESAELKKYKTHDELIEALRSIGYIRYIEEIN